MVCLPKTELLSSPHLFPGFPLYPPAAFFVYRDQASEEEWEDRLFMGPAQWDRVTEAFESDFADCDMVLFGTPTPLVFLSQRWGLSIVGMR